MRVYQAALIAAAFALGCWTTPAATAAEARFQHILIIVEENGRYDQIIGNPAAPNINRLAHEYGSATQYYAVAHPSQPNYLALLLGSTAGVHDDDAFFCKAGSTDPNCPHANQPNYGYPSHTVVGRSLLDQLAKHGLTWKGYFESIPAAGSMAVYSTEKLYAAKHNAFISLASVQNDPDRADKIVGFDQLAEDLRTGNVPNYAQIIPNQCNDMHGLDGPGVPAACRYEAETDLIRTGDRVVGKLVARIQASPVWTAPDNTAIVITWDEDDGPHTTRDAGKPQGCCGFDPKSRANYGGGRIATIVITNHGPRGITDDTPYNHYSLLRTVEDAFGITEHLNLAGDSKAGVASMAKLFGW